MARSDSDQEKRKLIGFAPEILQALELLARDTGRSLQELADEAFVDLLRKHIRFRVAHGRHLGTVTTAPRL